MTIAPPLTANGTTPPDPGRCTRKTGEADSTLESLEGVTEMATFGAAELGSWEVVDFAISGEVVSVATPT